MPPHGQVFCLFGPFRGLSREGAVTILMPMSSDSDKSLCLHFSDGTHVNCGLRISARAKTTRLRLSPQGIFELVVPRYVRFGESDLDAVLARLTPWAESAWQRLGAQPVMPMAEVPESLSVPVSEGLWQVRRKPQGVWPFGLSEAAEVPVNLHDRSADGQALCLRLVEDGNMLYLTGDTDNMQLCFRALQQWLFRKAEHVLPPIVYSMAQELGCSVAGVTVRRQRGRWGSCSSAARISLNYRALLLPQHLVRYLVLHELCHLFHMDHSPAYRRVVSRYEPAWRERERELSRAWRDMPAWILS